MLLVIEDKPVSPEINTCITVERIIDVLTACKYCDCEDYLSTVECCRGNAYLERCDFLDKTWCGNYCILWRPRCY